MHVCLPVIRSSLKISYNNSASSDMFKLTPILATNAELKKRLQESSYGTVEEHLKALNKYKMLRPEQLQLQQQVHMGLIMALLFDAQNNRVKIQHIKDVVNNKWMKSHPIYNHKHIPKSDYFNRGTIFNIIVECSRDPYFQGDLLDNLRCAGMFADQVIERVNHKTTPVYMDKLGNIKAFFDGSTDICNIFVAHSGGESQVPLQRERRAHGHSEPERGKWIQKSRDIQTRGKNHQGLVERLVHDGTGSGGLHHRISRVRILCDQPRLSR